MAEFGKFVDENKLDYNREFWNYQKVLQFLQGNAYNNKQTFDAMMEHEKFRADYLGPNNEKVLYEPVADLMVLICLTFVECWNVLYLRSG